MEVDRANQSINQERQHQSVEHGGVGHKSAKGAAQGIDGLTAATVKARRRCHQVRASTFGNADRVMRELAYDVDLYRASIEFSLFHVGQRIKLEYEMN